MKLYSDFGARRAVQILADLVAVTVIVLAIVAAKAVHAAILTLAGIGKTIENSGAGLQKTLSDAGSRLGGVPLIGSGIRRPFDSASDAAHQLAVAGQTQQDIVATSATVLAVLTAAVPIIAVLWIWLRRRIRFVWNATSVLRIARLPDGTDVLALRALTTASAHQLRGVGDTPAQSWRRGDPAVIAALARLSLRTAGLKP